MRLRLPALLLLIAASQALAAGLKGDPALAKMASPAQIRSLADQMQALHKRNIESLRYEPCDGAPECVRTVIVTFDPELLSTNAYRFSYTRAYLKSWKQEHYVAPEETAVDLVEWSAPAELYEYDQYQFALSNGSRRITIGNELPYDELQLILESIERGAYETDLFPENRRIVDVLSQKVPNLLDLLRVNDVTGARRDRKHGEYVYRLDVNPPDRTYERWYFVVRNGVCFLVGYDFYYV